MSRCLKLAPLHRKNVLIIRDFFKGLDVISEDNFHDLVEPLEPKFEMAPKVYRKIAENFNFFLKKWLFCIKLAPFHLFHIISYFQHSISIFWILNYLHIFCRSSRTSEKWFYVLFSAYEGTFEIRKFCLFHASFQKNVKNVQKRNFHARFLFKLKIYLG